MKMKILLLVVLLCGIFSSAITSAENTVQSPEEIARIKAINKEYERTHPRPKHSSRKLSSLQVHSTNGSSMDIKFVGGSSSMVVYKEENNNTYHTGRCAYYEELSNADFSRPYWLSDIIMDGVRCSLCIDEQTYYTCMAVIYKTELEELSETALTKKVQQQKYFIEILSILLGVLFCCLAGLIIKVFKQRKNTQNINYF